MHVHNESLTVSTAVLTVSDTRSVDDDRSGQQIQTLLKESNHNVVDYTIIQDDISAITSTIESWRKDPSIQAIIITGGTGFTPRDVTHEAVSSLLEKEMQGFGELFRSLSFAEIGPKSMFSRAVAGSMGRKAVYALPGSTNAVKLAMTTLILPTFQHFVEELNRQ
ncbi:MogA/MoaB family molybdenum cofactor biosynthesis protein [Bacillus fonticola]|uniref:MogA/MoaB family molybdenum cofactor biosynthesis protein n=1 Tax=Bacillus fonticola TaxID=2728853 RepID=UPI001475B0C9|nr:MogA/MoaB family molybdenum cofactor biosynthesis protein [Bacillus fonticola]